MCGKWHVMAAGMGEMGAGQVPHKGGTPWWGAGACVEESVFSAFEMLWWVVGTPMKNNATGIAAGLMGVRQT